jgi:hypothetical protein
MNPMKALVPCVGLFHAAFVGAGATDATLATDAQFPLEANLGSTCVRTSVGLFVVTLKDTTAQMLQCVPSIIGTEGLRATVKVNVATSAGVTTLTVNVWDPAGSLDDPETTDTLILAFTGYDTTA